MTISEAINDLHEELKIENVKLSDFDIFDDEDLIMFALRYLMANLDHAFEPMYE